VVVVRNPQNDDKWLEYFRSIREQCPWSLAAYLQGQIDFQNWSQDQPVPDLGDFLARIWIIDQPEALIESLCDQMDQLDPNNEWLFSYPGYGEWAAPYPILIQQNRSHLNRIRRKLEVFNSIQ